MYNLGDNLTQYVAVFLALSQPHRDAARAAYSGADEEQRLLQEASRNAVREQARRYRWRRAAWRRIKNWVQPIPNRKASNA